MYQDFEVTLEPNLTHTWNDSNSISRLWVQFQFNNVATMEVWTVV